MGDPASRQEASFVIRWAVFEDLARLESSMGLWELREANQRAFEAYRAGHLLWLVADIGSEPVGTIWGELFPEHDRSGLTVHVVSFRVHDSYQNRGIGSALLRSVEGEARLRGRRRATLFVAQDNAGAIRLYERHGYRISGSRTSRFEFRDPSGRRHLRIEEQYVMEKFLS